MSSLRVLPLLLGFGLGTGEAARADPSPSPSPVSVLDVRAAAPAAGLVLSGAAGGLGRGSAPGTFRIGLSLDGAFVPEGTGHPPAYHFAAGPRAELALSRSTAAWFGAAFERRQQGESAWSAPVFEAGARTTWSALSARAGLRHQRRHRSEPFQVWSWTAPDGFQSPPDTIPTLPYWTYPPASPVAVTAFELGVDWTNARWALEGTGGVAMGAGFTPVPLGAVRAVHWVGPDVGVVLGVRAAVPGWLASDFDARRRIELGIRFAPRGSDRVAPAPIDPPPTDEDPAWQALRRGPGLYTLRVRAPGATRVALRGDFTAWEAVDLEPAEGGWWERVVTVAAGLHEVEIAIDGRDWQPPPGALTTQGTYGQTVGLLVAE